MGTIVPAKPATSIWAEAVDAVPKIRAAATKNLERMKGLLGSVGGVDRRPADRTKLKGPSLRSITQITFRRVRGGSAECKKKGGPPRAACRPTMEGPVLPLHVDLAPLRLELLRLLLHSERRLAD